MKWRYDKRHHIWWNDQWSITRVLRFQIYKYHLETNDRCGVSMLFKKLGNARRVAEIITADEQL